MSTWALLGRIRVQPRPRLTLLATRHFSSTTWLLAPYTEHVQVPCASSGHVIVSLHDIEKHPVAAPLVINLPSFPVQDITAVDTYLPRFLHRYPTATIHYRWPQRGRPTPNHDSDASSYATSEASSASPSDTPLPHWPTPIHDTLAAYDYLTRTLTPPPTGTNGTNGHSRHQRRAIYVYGRHLGGTLAISLALTESHSHVPMAVRGLLAVNGVYNWTTFLPDHKINMTRNAIMQNKLVGLDAFEYEAAGGDIAIMKELLPKFFKSPGELFDPFASPLLFFHTAGLMVPPSFTDRWRPGYVTDKLIPPASSSSSASSTDTSDYVYSDPEDPPPPGPFPDDPSADTGADTNSDSDDAILAEMPFMAPPARQGYYTFPPRSSTLRIPDTLLIHNAAPPPPTILNVQRVTKAMYYKLKNAENSFGSQALGLARLMRRSVDKIEARGRMEWDVDMPDPGGEAARRVETGEVNMGEDGFENQEEAEEMARQWFEDHLG